MTFARAGGVVKVVAPHDSGVTALDFPLVNLLDEETCYAKLLAVLYPDSLACPRCSDRDHLGVHRRRRAPVLDYQCSLIGVDSRPRGLIL